MTHRERRRGRGPALALAAAVAALAVAPIVATRPVAAQAAAAPAAPAALAGLDAYVVQALRDWGAPGMAIAVIRNDSVVLARGYGVRELGKPERVTPRTLFAIGSTTKAFTAAALAMLVDEGKVKWDDPVTKYLPGFQLHDPFVTREMTVRDLLTHRSGLARGDRLWYASGNDRDEVLRRVRFLEPSWSFRSTYGYQNIMFLAAGQVVAAVAKQPWDDFVKARIFTPLGMRATVTSTLGLEGQPDAATPHVRIDGGAPRPVPWRNLDNVGPAGSINSNVAEMAEWVRLQLGRGTYRGAKLLSPAVVKEMHTPQMVVRMSEEAEKLFPETHLMAYGLAWAIRDYRGRKIVGHGGAIDGMRAEVALLPEEGLGVVVLTNVDHPSPPTAMVYRVIDSYLAPSTAGPKDWSARMLAATREREGKVAAEAKKVEAARVAGTKPSLPLERYAGTYADSMYGDVVVKAEGGKLVARVGPMYVGALEHWHFDTFRAAWENPVLGRAYVSFALDARGQVASLAIENLAVFGRRPDPSTVRAAGR